MDDTHPCSRLAAFATGGLVAVWIGGLVGAVGVKTVYWLWNGVWPGTTFGALLPDSALRAVVEWAADASLGGVTLWLVQLDILIYLLVIPPLLLAPCLAVLLLGRRPGACWRQAVRPFLPARERPRQHPAPVAPRPQGFFPTRSRTDSTKKGLRPEDAAPPRNGSRD